MIMLALSSSPSSPDSAYSSPSCSYIFADSVRKAPLRSRLTTVRDVATQTDPMNARLRKIAHRLAFFCDEFDKEFTYEIQDSPSFFSLSEVLWKWIL